MNTKLAIAIAILIILIGGGAYYFTTLNAGLPPQTLPPSATSTTPIATNLAKQHSSGTSSIALSQLPKDTWIAATEYFQALQNEGGSNYQPTVEGLHNNVVYCNSKALVPTPDLGTLQVWNIGQEGIDNAVWKDKANVWKNCTPFVNANPASFTYVGGDLTGFFKDATHVWYEMTPITGANASTFVFVAFDGTGSGLGESDFFTKDRDHVYYTHDSFPVEGQTGNQIIQTVALASADPATFTILPSAANQSGYEKDATHVYWVNHLIAGADVATFTLVTNSNSIDARDKNHTYSRGIITS